MLGIAASQFAFDCLPIQLLFSSALCVKICGAIYYFGISLYGSGSFESFIVLAIALLENFISNSSTTHYNKKRISDLMELAFRQCYPRHQILQILFAVANDVIQLYLTIQICVGVLLSSWGFYISLKNVFVVERHYIYVGASNNMHLRSHCYSLDIFGGYSIQKFANISKILEAFSKKREDQRCLRACWPMKFRVGPCGMVKAKLGLFICDDIIRNTVTMLLL